MVATNTDEPNLHRVSALQDVAVRSGIRLRPLVQTDAQRLLEILERDPTIRESVTVAARMHAEDDIAAEIAAMKSDPGLIRYAIADAGDGCIGLISFWRDAGYFGHEPRSDAYGFGYFLDPHERGKGIVTACLERLMNVSKHEFTVSTFMAFCEDNNSPSKAVLQGLGFTPTEQTYQEPTHGWTERLYTKTPGEKNE